MWREVRTALESNNLSKESTPNRQSDVLMTDSTQSVIQALTNQVAALTEQVKSMQDSSNSNCYATSSEHKRPEPQDCKHCGQTLPHCHHQKPRRHADQAPEQGRIQHPPRDHDGPELGRAQWSSAS